MDSESGIAYLAYRMTWSSERADADFAAAKHCSGFTVADDQTSLFIDVFRKGIVSEPLFDSQ